MALGTILAVVAAWRQGLADTLISSGLDILFAFPGILLAVLAAAVFGAGLTAAAIALSIAYMPYVARSPARRRSERARPAIRRGAGGTRFVGSDHLPAAHRAEHAPADRGPGHHHVRLGDGGPGGDLVLGLGVQPPAPNWGVMISENQPGILQGYPLPALAAGLCIVGVVIAFNLLGERLFQQAQARRRRRSGDDGLELRARQCWPAKGAIEVGAAEAPLLDVDGLTVRLPLDGPRGRCYATCP